MLTWKTYEILSYGAGTASTALLAMSCENAIRGYTVWPKVPIYDAVIFCDLHAEPSWVYEQAAFAAVLCEQAGISFYTLDANLYGDFIRNFGNARTASIPFWTINEKGKKGRMPRQCTYDYKIKLIEQFVRYKLLCYKPRERTIPLDVHAHGMHLGIMWEERKRAKPSNQTLFRKEYPLIEMGWTRPLCYAYLRDTWGMTTRASCCLFCPFHTNYFYQYIREQEPTCYARALMVDELVETHQAKPPLKSKLFISKSRKRLRNLSIEDCNDAQTIQYCGQTIWTGF